MNVLTVGVLHFADLPVVTIIQHVQQLADTHADVSIKVASHGDKQFLDIAAVCVQWLGQLACSKDMQQGAHMVGQNIKCHVHNVLQGMIVWSKSKTSEFPMPCACSVVMPYRTGVDKALDKGRVVGLPACSMGFQEGPRGSELAVE